MMFARNGILLNFSIRLAVPSIGNKFWSQRELTRIIRVKVMDDDDRGK
jgi:hypothetical protein